MCNQLQTARRRCRYEQKGVLDQVFQTCSPPNCLNYDNFFTTKEKKNRGCCRRNAMRRDPTLGSHHRRTYETVLVLAVKGTRLASDVVRACTRHPLSILTRLASYVIRAVACTRLYVVLLHFRLNVRDWPRTSTFGRTALPGCVRLAVSCSGS